MDERAGHDMITSCRFTHNETVVPSPGLIAGLVNTCSSIRGLRLQAISQTMPSPWSVLRPTRTGERTRAEENVARQVTFSRLHYLLFVKHQPFFTASSSLRRWRWSSQAFSLCHCLRRLSYSHVSSSFRPAPISAGDTRLGQTCTPRPTRSRQLRS
jgi:hypothetical protein